MHEFKRQKEAKNGYLVFCHTLFDLVQFSVLSVDSVAEFSFIQT
jgi:hypothetical protein